MKRDPDDTSTGRTIPPSTRAWTEHLVHVIDPDGRDITSWLCGPGDHRLIRGCGPADAPPPNLPICTSCVWRPVCGHCHDDPPAGHTCPRCGRVAGT